MDRGDARRAVALLLVFMRLARIGDELRKVVDDEDRWSLVLLLILDQCDLPSEVGNGAAAMR